MLKRISHFLATQGLVQVVNLICGILVLRILSVQDFAIYVLFAALQNIGSMCADMGLSQAMNTLGAKARGDRYQIGTIFRSAREIRRWLLAFSFLVMAVLAVVMLGNTVPSVQMALWGFLLVCVASWTQQAVGLHTSVLNAHHDSEALFKAGMTAAGLRLMLVAVLLPGLPNPLVAFGINAIGALVSLTICKRVIRLYVDVAAPPTETEIKHLKDFIYPLMPGALYFLVQGHVATVIFSIGGQVSNIAEVGALTRLAQILAFFAMLNPFWIQPSFARISSRIEFRRKAGLLLATVLLMAAFIVAATIAWPQAWLMVLGSQYSGLARELPFAVGFSLLSTIGATLFTLVMSIGDTRWQFLQILFGIGLQSALVIFWGVNSTLDALIISGAPLVSYALLQVALLLRNLYFDADRYATK